MSRMLQALRQIEASAGRSPTLAEPVPPAVSAAASRAAGVESPPAETRVAEATEHVFDQVESALAAEDLCPPDAAAAWHIEPLPALDSPGLEQSLAAEGGTGVSPVLGEAGVSPVSVPDPYAALADSIVAQWAAPGGENAEINGEATAGKMGTVPAVLLFTSPGDGEGKSTTLARLAPELQQRVSGEVLVVDGSLRAAAPAAQAKHPLERSSARGAGRAAQALPVRVGGRPVAAVFGNGAPGGLLRRDVFSSCGWGRRRGGPWRKRLP